VAGAAVLATALTTHAARFAGLFVGNVDVLDDPTSANRYGVTYDSISVTEQGPNGVSSMSFTIDDPLMLITVSVGMEVRFQRGLGTEFVPDFLGYVQSYGIRPAFGMQGRSIEVEAVGIEAVLDWALIAGDLVIPAGLEYYTAVQMLVALSVGAGELRAFVDPAVGPLNASDGYPLGKAGAGAFLTLGFTVTAGTSLREAIRQVIANLNKIGLGIPGTADVFDGFTTVDFFRGLRMWGSTSGSGYGNMTVNDTTGVDMYAEGLAYDTDASGVVRGVFVLGVGFSVLLMDGSGIQGPISYLTDDKADTAAKVLASAQTYLDDFAVGTRGSFRLEDRDPSGPSMITIHPGSGLDLTDTRIPVASAVPNLLLVGTIEKTYPGETSQTWTVSFGGMPPSLVNAMRRLTRTQRS
jgi:hypothetical protein